MGLLSDVDRQIATDFAVILKGPPQWDAVVASRKSDFSPHPVDFAFSETREDGTTRHEMIAVLLSGSSGKSLYSMKLALKHRGTQLCKDQNFTLFTIVIISTYGSVCSIRVSAALK